MIRSAKFSIDFRLTVDNGSQYETFVCAFNLLLIRILSRFLSEGWMQLNYSFNGNLILDLWSAYNRWDNYFDLFQLRVDAMQYIGIICTTAVDAFYFKFLLTTRTHLMLGRFFICPWKKNTNLCIVVACPCWWIFHYLIFSIAKLQSLFSFLRKKFFFPICDFLPSKNKEQRETDNNLCLNDILHFPCWCIDEWYRSARAETNKPNNFPIKKCNYLLKISRISSCWHWRAHTK